MNSAAAIASPNIAFIKYWGNRDHALRIPSSGSISMNLEGLFTRTQVSFMTEIKGDRLVLNDQIMGGTALGRVSALLERVRRISGLTLSAHVISHNNFPTGTGIASSASAFAALALAATHAAGLELSEQDLSRLARTGSGSACRSVPGGFVEWRAGEDDRSSYAYSIAPSEHWDLRDCIAIVSRAHKSTSSYKGHPLADTSPFQGARLVNTPRRLDICRQAILARDFETLAEIVELDSNMMHAVIMTTTPPLLYWQPATLELMHTVTGWRKGGLPTCYTIDAGPNVHVLCPSDYVIQVAEQLEQIPGVKEVLIADPGGPARLLSR